MGGVKVERSSAELAMASAICGGRAINPEVIIRLAAASTPSEFESVISRIIEAYDMVEAADSLDDEVDAMMDSSFSKRTKARAICPHLEYESQYDGIETITSCTICGK